jgi:protease I
MPSNLVLGTDGVLTGAKIGILIESDYYEPEIHYYERRFAEEGAHVHFLTRLWGNSEITFLGHEWHDPFTANETFEGIDDDELRTYDAIIVPSGMVSDRLRFTEDVNKIPPATEFLRRAFAQPSVLKGIICHGMWLVAPAPELVAGRQVTVHNNLIGDAKAYGAKYVDADVVHDGDDLITGRTGQHAHLFAHALIKALVERRNGGQG